ncbi:hypothetical protein D9M68_917170 [compost metagenome]
MFRAALPVRRNLGCVATVQGEQAFHGANPHPQPGEQGAGEHVAELLHVDAIVLRFADQADRPGRRDDLLQFVG